MYIERSRKFLYRIFFLLYFRISKKKMKFQIVDRYWLKSEIWAAIFECSSFANFSSSSLYWAIFELELEPTDIGLVFII